MRSTLDSIFEAICAYKLPTAVSQGFSALGRGCLADISWNAFDSVQGAAIEPNEAKATVRRHLARKRTKNMFDNNRIGG